VAADWATGTTMTDAPQVNQQHQAVGGHHHRHGRLVSWVLVAVVVAAFCAGGAAIIARWWWLFWVCAGIVVLSVPAGWGIGIIKDTVEVDPGPRRRVAASGRDSAADPGVRLD
jgi:hypothetical protein